MRDLKFFIYFAEDGFPAPEGPGWYLYSTRQNRQGGTEEIVPHVRLTPEEVGKLGLIFDNLTTDKPLNWTEQEGYHKYEGTISDAVIAANEDAKTYVEQKLDAAEAEYQRLEQLRARVEEFK